MCLAAGAAFHEHLDAQTLELGGHFRNNGDTRLPLSGLREDTDDYSHADYSQLDCLLESLNYGIRVDYL